MTKNWEFFEFAVKQHEFQLLHYPDRIESIGENEENFTAKLRYSFDKAKIFAIDTDVKQLLVKTDGTKEIDKLPFDTIFIDVDFDVAYLNQKQFEHDITHIKGIMISSVNAMVTNDEGEKHLKESTLVDLTTLRGIEGFRIWALCLDKQGGYSFNTVNVVNPNDIYDKKLQVVSKQPKIRQFVLNFVSNFLNLLNNQPTDISISEKIYSEAKNKQRERKGMMRVPNKKIIIPKGKLKQYIRDYSSVGDNIYSHKFWVRGHWKVFKSDRYKEARGKKRWVYPFLKGKGLIIEKKYEVKIE